MPTFHIEEINSGNWRPGMLREGHLVRYRPHPSFGWLCCRCFPSQPEAEAFAASLDSTGNIPQEGDQALSENTVKGIELLLAAAQAHGENSGDMEHQVGDLEGIARVAWEIMTPRQRLALLNHPEVVEQFELDGDLDDLQAVKDGLDAASDPVAILAEAGKSASSFFKQLGYCGSPNTPPAKLDIALAVFQKEQGKIYA